MMRWLILGLAPVVLTLVGAVALRCPPTPTGCSR